MKFTAAPKAAPKSTAKKTGFAAKRGDTSFNFGANVVKKGGKGGGS